MAMFTILLIPLAYLIGSISSAIIISRLRGLDDPRKVGSGNPGATNVLRSGDKTAAALTLLGDILKGLVPVLIAKWMQVDTLVLAFVGLAAFLGHLYPVYYDFKGGKGVATACGVILALNGWVALILVGIWLTLAFITRYSSLSALISAVSAPILFAMLGSPVPIIMLACVIAIMLLWRHRENIKRLREGTETRIKLPSKDKN